MANLRFVVFVTVFVAFLQIGVEPKGQYVQPMLMGMQVAIPYDIANVFNRPVALGPLISTFLGLALLYILFFGVITSPFGYMFGVPSQKYVLGIGDDSFIGALVKAAEQWEAVGKDSASTSARSLATPIIRKLIQYKWEYPEFNEAVFQFTPDRIYEEPPCQELILCYAHSSLRSLPEVSVPLFRVFSKTLTNVTERHRDAIILGLNGENCDSEYDKCPYDIYSLVARSFTALIPKWLRRTFMLPQFR